MQRSTWVAECVNIKNITLNTDNTTALILPFACKPGVTKCQYRTPSNEIAFNLSCECGMKKESISGEDIGYCPLPNMTDMQEYIKYAKLVWFQDNCHTYDRDNFYA